MGDKMGAVSARLAAKVHGVLVPAHECLRTHC